MFGWNPVNAPRTCHKFEPGTATGFCRHPVDVLVIECGIFDPPVKMGIDMQRKDHCLQNTTLLWNYQFSH